MTIRSASYRSVASILQQGLDRLPPEEKPPPRKPCPGTATCAALAIPTEGKQTMLNQQTTERLRALRLIGMLEAWTQQREQPQTHDLSFDERFALLVEREVLHRENRRLARLLKAARLHVNA